MRRLRRVYPLSPQDPWSPGPFPSPRGTDSGMPGAKQPLSDIMSEVDCAAASGPAWLRGLATGMVAGDADGHGGGRSGPVRSRPCEPLRSWGRRAGCRLNQDDLRVRSCPRPPQWREILDDLACSVCITTPGSYSRPELLPGLKTSCEHAGQRISMLAGNALNTQEGKIHCVAGTSGCRPHVRARCCGTVAVSGISSRSSRSEMRNLRRAWREVQQRPWTPADSRGSTARKYSNRPGFRGNDADVLRH